MLAIIKCVAHQKTNSLIAKGNNLADEAAKRIATPTCIGPLLVAGDCEPLTNLYIYDIYIYIYELYICAAM